MADGKSSKAPKSRDDRLKAALKANMAKRKAQARARHVSERGTASGKKAGEDKSDG